LPKEFAVDMLALYAQHLNARKALAPAPASLQPQNLGYVNALLIALDFAKRMRAHGLAVEANSLLSNAAYARECSAQAHTQSCARLRAAAMRMFELHAA
jgi:hypothetical protein